MVIVAFAAFSVGEMGSFLLLLLDLCRAIHSLIHLFVGKSEISQNPPFERIYLLKKSTTPLLPIK